MMRRLERAMLHSRLMRGEQGGIAILMLLAFIALAVPLALAAAQTSAQFARTSRVYDKRLTAMYAAGAGVEVALWQMLNDPTFDNGLSPTSPSKVIAVDSNGENITVTVTKIFTGATLQGQGMDIKKTVTPATVSADTPTTYTYTITVTNIGTDTNLINRATDQLPPGFTYVPGSTTGLTTLDPTIQPKSTNDNATWYLNDAAGSPYPWNVAQGSDSAVGTYTPVQGAWETLPEYWEITMPVDGTLSAGAWQHRQWWYTPEKNNRWRWKIQRVRGAQVTDLFTSQDQKVDKESEWKEKKIEVGNPGAFPVLAGDILRLRLEVYSDRSDPADRQFDYRWGGANDYDSRTEMPGFAASGCDDVTYELKWDNIPDVPIAAGEELTLSFQATATRPDGTFYNQAWVRFEAWWDNDNYDVRTPPTAPVTVGTGVPKCGAGVIVDKTVDPQEAPPGVETTFTYTISIENAMVYDLPLKHIHDLLPPGFTYVSGSSSGFWPYEPDDVKWKADHERWELKWDVAGAASVPAGQTVVQTFQATATLETGYDYSNEAWVDWEERDCVACPPGGHKSYSSPTGTVQGPPTYDVQAVAADGTVLARVQLWEVDGTLDILSWQEY